ncbi:hypothetical protein ACFV7R_30115 [Streptomyces sp. NPDC059866]|uniref:hypothetical protein n=1 Tax=Streptomyces sp. NPDC059866 TaxID=3346978 RepID=UPI00366290B6
MRNNDRYAMLIGVSTYDSDAYHDLPAVRADLPRTAVSAEFLERTLQSCRAASKIVLLDCCASGSVVQGRRAKGGDDSTSGEAERNRMYCIACNIRPARHLLVSPGRCQVVGDRSMSALRLTSRLTPDATMLHLIQQGCDW